MRSVHRFCSMPQTTLTILALLLTAIAAFAETTAPRFAWQADEADVQPTGEITWAPKPFAYSPGQDVRYIDFDSGSDDADGKTHETAWKHHPWDPAAQGQARQADRADTYVFKRGVTYRGRLIVPDLSSNPGTLQLTSDPAWTTGKDAPAVFAGSERVTQWQRGAEHPDIPDAENVWHADLDYTPRCVWMVRNGEITRIPLARTPNWTVSNPDDVKAEWYQFDNPFKPHFKRIKVGKDKMHYAADTKHLTKEPDYYKDAYIWTEYGWVMGTPYASRIGAYYPEEHALAIEGQWGKGAGSYHLPRYTRYFLEDKPHYLDDPTGEFWFDRKGDGGRLYLRLPDNLDPNNVQVEAARHATLIDIKKARRLKVSGLTFRFTNVFWDLDAVITAGPDVNPAVVRLLGAGEDIEVSNCTFEHVNSPVRMVASGREDKASLDRITISDNDIRYTEDGAITLSEGSAWAEAYPVTRLYDVAVLRNRLYKIALRPTRFSQGDAINILYPRTARVAGNVLDRTWGAGIMVYGSKAARAKTDRPLSRILVYQNQVTDCLLNNNDYGGIETWRIGPAYVYNNVSGNPGGFKLWGIRNNPKSPTAARFGHAYYMDGAFKQYFFNNIAWGKSNEPGSELANTDAFQEIHGYYAYLFNNTAYNFLIGSRRQAPAAGRNKYLGNIWHSMGLMVFRHAKPKNVQADPNSMHVGKNESIIEHETNAYDSNVFYNLPEQIAVFEKSGVWYGSLDLLRQAMSARGTIGDVGEAVEESPLQDPASHDFRPTAAAKDRGVKVFVPWGLYGVVGEWHFYHAGNDATVIPDESIHAAPYYVEPRNYYKVPTYPLRVANAGDDAFVNGPLEDWTKGTLKLDGKRYAVLASADIDGGGVEPMKVVNKQQDWITFDAPEFVMVGEKLVVKITLHNAPKDMKLRADLHWRGREKGGGMATYGGAARPVKGDGPYTYAFGTPDKPGVGCYQVVAWLTPSGGWDDKTSLARFAVPAVRVRPDFRTPQIKDTNFLVETYLRVQPQSSGVIMEKMSDVAGYSLTLDAKGRVKLMMRGGGEEAAVAAEESIADGEWHHVIAEADRSEKQIRIYIDGKQVASGSGLGAVPLTNNADVHVGGAPNGRCLSGDMDFLRIAIGTLADARTTIDELYAWQFNGPFLRDFRSRPTQGRRDAGVMELTD